MLHEKAKLGTYYLIYDDVYFEEIRKNTMITREIYTLTKRILKPFNILKYFSFNFIENYSTEQIYELIQILRKDTTIITTIFNPKSKELFILFVSNKDDSLLEHHIKTFLELEVI